MIGPVQVLVVGLDRPAFSGAVLAEFTRLTEAGVVRLVDLLLVSRAVDGTLETVGTPAGIGADLGGLAAALLGRPHGGAGAGEVGAADAGSADAGSADAGSTEAAEWSLADAVPPGSTAAVALIEHIWAADLVAAIQQAGGTPLEETWLSSGDRELLDAMLAQRAPQEQPAQRPAEWE
jgi:uncharacterized membrane protein